MGNVAVNEESPWSLYTTYTYTLPWLMRGKGGSGCRYFQAVGRDVSTEVFSGRFVVCPNIAVIRNWNKLWPNGVEWTV